MFKVYLADLIFVSFFYWLVFGELLKTIDFSGDL